MLAEYTLIALICSSDGCAIRQMGWTTDRQTCIEMGRSLESNPPAGFRVKETGCEVARSRDDRIWDETYGFWRRVRK